MMQETMLRVFVVALGLLLCPRDNPTVEDWDEVRGSQKHEETLQSGEEKLDSPTKRAGVKMTESDKTGLQGDELWSRSDQHAVDEDKRSNVTQQGHDQKLPNKNASNQSGESLQEKVDIKPKTEENGKDIQTNSSLKEAGSLQGHRNPEDGGSGSEELESHLPHIEEAEVSAQWEKDDLWFVWNTFSIISVIRFFSKYLRKNSQTNQEERFPSGCRAAEAPLPDADTLHHFYKSCVQLSAEKTWRDGEFLEGFVNDLLGAMRTICENSSSMVMEDFHVVSASDIIVPLSPPEPFGLQRRLWDYHASDRTVDHLQVCGRIKLVEEKKIQNGCHCQSSAAADGDDTVCLLHCSSEKVETKPVDVCDGLLCSKSTPYLSKSKVSRWFQSNIKQAWAQISHKYEFELHIRYMDAPGALVIRFRSGRKIRFNVNPVIKFNSEAHFFITPGCSGELDTLWTLSLTNYEDRLLEHLSKRLPENSCHNQTLGIAYFLHKRQSALSGSSALTDSHFKTAFMHLLLTKKVSEWRPDFVACRLRDLLDFMEKSLEKKLLAHILIGNPLAKVIELPVEITKAKPVNVFQPLVEHNCFYINSLMHFQEMLRNAHMLIHDCVAQRTNRAKSEMFQSPC
ncbi:inositol 1,4,5-trisphosphate receptor-interacting protein [Nothobranchius furzeri]|uniref:Inositol 1,4,5-trisphosphate receptor-interacting protein n=2 Tax=Nothobranchius furzeri TaxID=105023 RepID=A0A8C6KBK6_NOTFU|nr:5-trisphosphate receptor-interacting protein-like [Nothobranchius furzeri]